VNTEVAHGGRAGSRDRQSGQLLADDRRCTTDEQETLAAARLLALDRMPYLASALFEVVVVRSPGLDTFAVDDRWRLYVGPAALERWSVQEVAGVLLHEVGHLVRDHHTRHAEQAVTDGLLWNLAGDAEINDDLLAAGIPLPGAPVTPSSIGAPDGQLAERYFAHLLDLARSDRDPGCGSGAGGRAVPEELVADDPSWPGRSDLDQDLVRRAVAEAIAEQDAARGVEAGTIPGGWRRWAARTLAPPAVPWRHRLRRSVRRSFAVTAGQVDTSYQRPGRRRLPRIVTPGTVQPKLRVGVVLDTSSSMMAAQLEAALAELDGICRRAGLGREDRVVVTADVEVHEVPHLRNAAELTLVGGGGTDLRPALRYLVGHRLRPRTLVVLTDGFTPWPSTPPRGCSVIAVLLARHDELRPERPPPWIDTIHLGSPG
jgi:predicted metal-dependent peptidase